MPETRSQYEPDLARPGPLWWLLALTLAAILALSGLIWWLFDDAQSPAPVPEVAMPARAPALQRAPVAEYQAFHRRAEDALHSVGWVDREAGVVHMPIERAMALLVERGLAEEGAQ